MLRESNIVDFKYPKFSVFKSKFYLKPLLRLRPNVFSYEIPQTTFLFLIHFPPVLIENIFQLVVYL